ncbi:MAG: thioesterase family protein [Bacteroidetes bacterium]|nr:thioesterase family protein [Bacteroidota bacterium]
MARIKLKLPEHFSYSTEIIIRIDDINYGGHLGNDSVLSIMHEARIRYLKEYEVSELKFGKAGLIMADTVIVYKSEGFHQDVIKVEVTATDFSKFGFDIYYKLVNKSTDKDLAHAKTGMVCYDYEKKKIVLLDETMKEKMSL